MASVEASRHANLAASSLQRGQVDLAATHVASALGVDPDNLTALVIAAMIEAERQNIEGAEAYVRRALEIDGENEGARIFLSRLLALTDRFEEAIGVAEAAVSAKPGDVELLNHLGFLLAQAGRLDDAVTIFHSALELNSRYTPALQNLAAALSESGRESEALSTYEKLTKLEKNQVAVWVNFARLLHGDGRFLEAADAADEALRLDKVNQPAHLVKGLALLGVARGSEAELHLRRAVKFNPNDGLAKAAMGYCLQEKGDFAESLTMIEEAIRLIPHHGLAYFNYLRAKNARELPAEFIPNLEAIASDQRIHIRDAAYMNYALGKAYEDLEDYETAMRHYDIGNRFRKTLWFSQRQWASDAYQEGITETIQTFDEDRLQALRQRGLTSQLPLIIVGMMRSGTSLLEQILSSHPEVVGAGELPFWHEFEHEAYDDERIPNAEKIRGLGERYLASIEEMANGASRVTDKLPHNYAKLGLIHAAFPEAKLIHVKRNAADNCLSIYTTAYQRPPMFAHDRNNIVLAYREYQRITAHWRQVLPADRLMEVRYEDLIADRETMTRQLIEFAGLEWSDECLHHERNKRSVRTPSLWQVRQPIYKTSVERWRRFEPWIPEFAQLAQQS